MLSNLVGTGLTRLCAVDVEFSRLEGNEVADVFNFEASVPGASTDCKLGVNVPLLLPFGRFEPVMSGPCAELSLRRVALRRMKSGTSPWVLFWRCAATPVEKGKVPDCGAKFDHNSRAGMSSGSEMVKKIKMMAPGSRMLRLRHAYMSS